MKNFRQVSKRTYPQKEPKKQRQTIQANDVNNTVSTGEMSFLEKALAPNHLRPFGGFSPSFR